MTTELPVVNQVETDRALIEAELHRLLRQKKFSAAAQMSAFLKYIVTQTLDGNGDRIKAYTVGVDALGKPDSFDAQNDPSVRVLALRLRKSLNASYEHNEGLHNTRIVLKVGTYVPEFIKVAHKPESDANVPVDRPHLKIADLAQPAAPSARHSRKSESADRPAVSESAGITLRVSSWIITGMLLLVVMVWLVSASKNNSFARDEASSNTGNLIAETASQAMVLAETKALQDTNTSQNPVPTLYIPSNDKDSTHLKHIAMLLGSSVVQQGNVYVVNLSQLNAERRIADNGYWIVISEIALENKSTVVAQLLRQDSGAVLMSTMLTLDATEVGVSRETMRWIEKLASDISNTTGPLFQDHCAKSSLQSASSCLQVASRMSKGS